MIRNFKPRSEFKLPSGASVGIGDGEDVILYNANSDHFAVIYEDLTYTKEDQNFSFVFFGADADGERRVRFTDPETTEGIQSVSEQLAMAMFIANFDPNISVALLKPDEDVSERDIELYQSAIQNAGEIVLGKPLVKPVAIKGMPRNS